MVVLLSRPPHRRPPVPSSIAAGLDSSDRSGDKRPLLLVLVLLVLFFVLAAIPLGDQLLGFTLLPRPTDYPVVGLAILAWVVIDHLFWWVASRWGWWIGDRSPVVVHPSPPPDLRSLCHNPAAAQPSCNRCGLRQSLSFWYCAFRLAEPPQFLKIPVRILGELVYNLNIHACGGHAGLAQHPGDGICPAPLPGSTGHACLSMAAW